MGIIKEECLACKGKGCKNCDWWGYFKKDDSEVIYDIIEYANNKQLANFLNLTEKEIEALYEEETLTDLYENIQNKYAMISDKEFEAFLKEIDYLEEGYRELVFEV